MRLTRLIVVFVFWTIMGFSTPGSAQPAGAPLILNVTTNAAGDLITITGRGFGQSPLVTVDGQPMTVLVGSTDTQVTVIAPAALVTAPGTYRLTVVDPVRQLGDAFVVASQVATVSLSGADSSAAPAAATGGVPATTGSPVTGPAVTAPSPSSNDLSPSSLEDSGPPFRTAIGFQALLNNTTGSHNTAGGYWALRLNTTGDGNTAGGALALNANTTGGSNTATGLEALWSNTTGSFNTATGTDALASNTTGNDNTAIGRAALLRNTTGTENTASGVWALSSNTGSSNSASGAYALTANTTGFENTAIGARALSSNTTGNINTASGVGALNFNTTGFANMASGVYALQHNTTGTFNTASGVEGLFWNTTGDHNTGSGAYALLFNTTGSYNAALGSRAGWDATTGSYNLFLGADVTGTAADTNTIRIGLPYSGGIGQNRTFVAGIRGTTVGGALPVVIDANGQMGTDAAVPHLVGNNAFTGNQTIAGAVQATSFVGDGSLLTGLPGTTLPSGSILYMRGGSAAPAGFTLVGSFDQPLSGGSGLTNVASAANGATAVASSTHSAGYAAGGAINGDRKGDSWGGGGGWNDGTQSAFPDWLEVDFQGAKTIGEIDVFTVQDSYFAPSAPTPTMTSSLYGLTDFQVQQWDGAAWVTVPGGNIVGNTLVWRKITFPALTTTKIRVFVTGALASWSRITEVEAYDGTASVLPIDIYQKP